MKTTPSVYTVVVSNVGTVYQGLNRARARAEYDECVAISKNVLSGRWMGEDVTLFEDGEILAEYHPPNPKPKPITDKDRMNFLIKKIVEVREPQFYGSKFMFTSQVTAHDPDEPFPDTTLRAQIDAALLAEAKEKKDGS